MSKIAVIAALERELRPWVNGWSTVTLDAGAKCLRVFENADLVAVAGGIGCANAEHAARVVVEKYRPQTLISAGVAGALIHSLKVSSVILPNVIVDAATGAEYRSTFSGEIIGGGILVSVSDIAASPDAKSKLVEQFHALAVDMEAAGVAKVAQQAQIGFRCVKAISDEAGFKMPPVSRFVDTAGNFETAKFAAWVSVRPWLWARTIALGRNTGRATKTLCEWLTKNLQPPDVSVNGARLAEAKQ